jgi:hypothetical protein
MRHLLQENQFFVIKLNGPNKNPCHAAGIFLLQKLYVS